MLQVNSFCADAQDFDKGLSLAYEKSTVQIVGKTISIHALIALGS